MNDKTTLLSSPHFYMALLIGGLLWAVIWLGVKVATHECPKPNVPEINAETINELNTISDAKDKNTLDSLLIKYYGFSSE